MPEKFSNIASSRVRKHCVCLGFRDPVDLRSAWPIKQRMITNTHLICGREWAPVMFEAKKRPCRVENAGLQLTNAGNVVGMRMSDQWTMRDRGGCGVRIVAAVPK